MYFISLSASDNTLPLDSNSEQKRRSKLGNNLLSLLNFIFRKKEDVLPKNAKKFWKINKLDLFFSKIILIILKYQTNNYSKNLLFDISSW